MKHRKFVPDVPGVVPDFVTIGNNVLQVKNSAIVPDVPDVPDKNNSYVVEQKAFEEQQEIASTIALNFPDPSMYVKNREHREQGHFLGVFSVPGHLEQMEQHREQHREQAAIVATGAPASGTDYEAPALEVIISGLTWTAADVLHAELKATVPGQRLYGIKADPAQPGAWRIVKRNY